MRVGGAVSARRVGGICVAVVVCASLWWAAPASAAAGGTKLWVARYAGFDGGAATATAASPDGSRLYATGAAVVTPAAVNDYVTIAYNPTTGAQLWLSSYATTRTRDHSCGCGLSTRRSSATTSPRGSRSSLVPTESP